jgi:hypothetical protein
MVIAPAKETDIFSDALMKRMEDNEHYATFDVVGFIEKEAGTGKGAGAKIYKQVGTLADIAGPATATILKDLEIIHSIALNKAKQSTAVFLKEFYPDRIAPAERRFVNNHMEIIDKNDDNTGTMYFMHNGKIEGYYIDRRIADAFVWEESPIQNCFMQSCTISARPSALSSRVYAPDTCFSTLLETSSAPPATLPDISLTSNCQPILSRLWAPHGNPRPENLPRIRTMLKEHMLISTVTVPALITSTRRLSASRHSLMSKTKNLGPLPAWKKAALVVLYSLVRAGKTVERIPKIAAYTYIKKNFPDMPEAEIAHRIRTELGSPDFLEKGRGTFRP